MCYKRPMRNWVLLAASLAIAGGCGRSTTVGPSTLPVPLPDPPRAALSVGATTPALVLVGQPLTFDASASTGEGLTYQLEFGDGQVVSEPIALHATSRASRLTARLTVRDRLGRGDTGSVPYLVVAVDEPLFWFHNSRDGNRNTTTTRRFFLRQGETGASGTYSGPEGNGLRVTGVFTGERGLRLVADDGTMEWSGGVEWRADTDHHWGLSASGVVLRLRVVRGSTEGAEFDFHYADPY